VITKHFKGTPIKIAFRTWNTIQNIIKAYSQWHILNEMPTVPIKICRRNRIFHTRYKNIHRQLQVIMETVVDDVQVG
jgi:hypothetical protein